MRLLLAAWFALAPLAAASHEVRPAAFEARATSDSVTQIVWRQPVAGDYGVPLVPRLSSGWLDAPPTSQQRTPQTLTRIWQVQEPIEALAGQVLQVDGLDATLTDVFVRIEWRHGDPTIALLRPAQAGLPLGTARSAEGARAYLKLGITHIWSGYDHLLYLVGLLLLVRGLWPLLQVITAFTLAHSVTLALSALDILVLPPAPVEACIALSVVMVAAEAARAGRGGDSLALRKPWLVALLFGLLHGFGFAGALREAGLPADAVVMPLLLFNLGIEAGQIAFVTLVTLLALLLVRGLPALQRPARAILPLALGGLAMAWLYERLGAMF